MVHSTPPVQHTNSVLIEEIRKIIWSEWNDANVNAIKWDIPFKARKEDGPFDPHPVFLPASLHPMIYQWKSFHELFQEPLSIFVETNDIPKFVDENRHLFHSEFMRNFFSSICLLQYISTKDIFLIERETTVFSCGTSGQPWRPWHHIYSGNKAGKGQGAKPVFNNAGTYVIRLFYLGFWREIIVDDQVPVDINDIPLLPFLTVNGTLVVWPILLSKALLKIAQLSWTVNCELVDFDIITCLTGWIAQNVELKNLSNEDIWKICRAYSNHYVWPATNVEVLQTKAGKGKEPPKEIPKAPPYYVTGNIKDLRHLEKEEIPDITPCWSHSFLIEQSRDIPLTKPEPRKELPLWKTFRWEEWAIEKGILPPKEDDTPLWFIKIVDFLRQICETEALKPSTLPPISGSDEKEVPQFWSDLHKLGKNLSHIIIYFKPSEFKINITVTNLVPSTEQMKPPFDAEHRKETIGWPNKVRLSKNEPLYIFTDSISEKFVVMALSHESARLPYSFNEEYQISDWDSHCDIFRSKSAITAEKYLWNQFKIGSVMFKISTVGTSCQLFNFNKGRILLALWIRSSTSYVLNILSDSRLIVGKWNLITDQLKSEAQQMVLFSNNLSLAFSNLFGELGYENFQHALHSFYSSYKPDLKYDKSMSQYIHTDYVQAILRYIEKIFDKSTFELMKYAFKVLFLNPKIACSETEVVNAQHFYDAKNKAAVLIQAHVRSFLIRQLKKHHNVLDPVYKEVVQELQSVYDLCFKASIRIETTPKIIRIFFKYSHISDLGENYSLYPDLCNVVRVIPHNGIISNIGPDDWVPIALLSFICLEDDITLRIDLECQLPLTMLRVFNNDTLVEKRRITNSVLPSKYRKNKFGYTIYAYGWNNGYTLQSLDWKVNIIHQLTDHELVETGKSENYRYDLHGCYIPNVYNIICKAVIKIEKTALVIIRVHLSYDKAKFVLRCKTGSGKVLKEIKGFENITLSPLLLTHNVGSGDDINESFSDYLSRLDMKFSSSFGSHLDSPRKSASRRLVKRKVSRDLRSTSSIISLNKIPQTKISEGDLESTYYIEAYVLDDSWPLTANEWRQTQNAKLHSCRSFSPPIDSKDLAKPYWKLSVIATDHISVARNWQREIEIETMKTSWEQTDPGRFQRAAEIRHNFLSEMCTNNSDSDTMVTTVSSLPRVKSSLAGFNRKRSRLSYKGKSQELSISHTCVPDDENTPRTLLPEVEKSKSLPQIDLSLYIKQNPIYDEMKEMLLDKLRYLVTTEKVFLKDENDAKVEAEFREYAMEYNKRYQEYFREQTNKYMCNQFDSYDYLLNHSDYERGRSKLLMEEAYEVRTICIIKQLQDQFGPEVAAKMLGGSKKK